jgi:hypothetical protein
MVLFPETQSRAQEELDKVVGRGRLPSVDDLEKLPYIQAMVPPQTYSAYKYQTNERLIGSRIHSMAAHRPTRCSSLVDRGWCFLLSLRL